MTSKGKVEPINTDKYGSETGTELVMDYLTNKLSPVASVLLDMVNRSTFGGAPLTVGGEAMSGFAPFPIANYIQGLKSVTPADSLLAEIADSFGLYETLPYVPPKK